MIISPPEEAQNETATRKKKASQKTAARRKNDAIGNAVLNKDTAVAAIGAASKAKTKTAKKRATKVPSQVTAEVRQQMVAAAAYYRAEARGFEPGHEHEDWLLAEREVDAILGS